MAYIDLKDVIVEFPIYNASGRSLKKRLIQMATGGKVDVGEEGYVVVRALNGITLTIHEGEKVGLIGHNGSGKSTMLRLLSRVYEPISGTADIQGSVGSLIELALGINPEATGRENIYIRGALLGLKKNEIHERIDEIIDFCGLGSFVDLPLRTYSSGMHMRLAFAVSTIIQPDILLMDEWLAVGDESFRQKSEDRLASIVEKTRILVIASHSRELISRICNRVIWLEHGLVRMDGIPEAVLPAYFS